MKNFPLSMTSAAAICVTALLGFAACSVYRSSASFASPADPSRSLVVAHGALQPYFLPRGFVRLEIKEVGQASTPTPAPKPKDGSSTVQDTEAASAPPRSKSETGSPVTPVDPVLSDMPVTDVATAWKGTTQVHIRMTTILAPDYRRGPIYSRFVGNVLSHDQPQLNVNERHLLSSTTTTTEDKTPQILEDLTDVFVDVAKFASARSVLAHKEVPEVPIDIDQTFDPTCKSEVGKVNGALGEVGFELQVDGGAAGQAQAPSDKTKVEEGGLRFRLPSACDLVLTYNGPRQGKRVVHSATLPDPAREYLFVVSRGAFISKTTHLRIKDGMTRGFDVDKPSELQGLTGTLVAIAGKIVSLPKDLLTVRVNYKNEQKNLTTAEQQYYAAQKQLLDAQREYAAALHPQPAPSVTPAP